MLWIEKKYISLLSYRLDKFKNAGNNVFNCRCPLCGDSKKSTSKARGYIYLGKGAYWFKCHNCHASKSFVNLLKAVDYSLYSNYRLELFENTSPRNDDVDEIFKRAHAPREKSIFDGLKKISQLPENHYAKRYVVSRKIPSHFHHKLYFTDHFNKFVNEILPDKLDPKYVEARLVIPFFDSANKVIGLTGRAFSDEGRTLHCDPF
jgi:transcription elongation factor Elf1